MTRIIFPGFFKQNQATDVVHKICENEGRCELTAFSSVLYKWYSMEI
jgi:hypothetical protein